jgi:hypothetical protein
MRIYKWLKTRSGLGVHGLILWQIARLGMRPGRGVCVASAWKGVHVKTALNFRMLLKWGVFCTYLVARKARCYVLQSSASSSVAVIRREMSSAERFSPPDAVVRPVLPPPFLPTSCKLHAFQWSVVTMHNWRRCIEWRWLYPCLATSFIVLLQKMALRCTETVVWRSFQENRAVSVYAINLRVWRTLMLNMASFSRPRPTFEDALKRLGLGMWQRHSLRCEVFHMTRVLSYFAYKVRTMT